MPLQQFSVVDVTPDSEQLETQPVLSENSLDIKCGGALCLRLELISRKDDEHG